MTNTLPTLINIAWMPVHPSLADAAVNLGAQRLATLSDLASRTVTAGQYELASFVLSDHALEPTATVLGQLLTARQMFFGGELPPNFLQALASLPPSFGDATVERVMRKFEGANINAIAARLIQIGSSPYFSGNFKSLRDRLLKNGVEADDAEQRICITSGPGWNALMETLKLPMMVGMSLQMGLATPYQQLPLGFMIRNFAAEVRQHQPPWPTLREMRDLFLGGFHADDENIRSAFLLMAPAICADPGMEEGLKAGCAYAVGQALLDPSPEIRRIAEDAHRRLHRPGD